MYAFLAYFGLLIMSMCDMAETITMKAGTQPKAEVLSVKHNIYVLSVKC